ncbi:hypothetical protein [Gelidibacter gilvus]|uniref:Serine kinase n=1 Tax=Gelidibacter gilvus TaxID=59602 RepID=A0A4Q0XDS1_9FLAO|nr:hypothetical protein [Gelidibacter gilvus]RXJ46015.1 hypothetical protein ESZ48_13050 [Gelidibacter gilvus]
MKNNFFATNSTQLSDSWVLWFEASNQYIVISKALKVLLDVYFASESEYDFNKQLKSFINISNRNSNTYYAEINELLKEVNTSSKSDTSNKSSTVYIKKTDFKKNYRFGNTSITVNYGSIDIQNLIHPQWSHAAVLKEDMSSTVFDIFEKENHLYLFINKRYIGHYPVSEYHLLTGQFALQLINTLYHKNEADWIATFHASTVCNDKEAIMIIGDSGNGKSTLSAVLMANGIDVLADDFTPLLAEDCEAYRFPSGISVKKGAFSVLEPLFPNFNEFPLYKSNSKNVTIKYIPPINGFGQTKSHFPCKKIVYVNYDANANTSEMKEIGIEKILETLIPESWLSPLGSNSKLFLDWLKGLCCYELTYADNAFAVSKFSELFDS